MQSLRFTIAAATLTAATLTAALLAPTAADAATRGGTQDERVNLTVASTQERPEVAVYEKGWVAVWQSREGTLDLEIRARAKGPLGESGEIEVNSVRLGTQQVPDVAVDALGNFVVVWYGNEPAESGGDDSGYGISARLFDSEGVALTPEFQVNDITDGHQMDPAVAMNADGDFVVTWRSSTSAGNDDSGSSVQARLFNAAGVPQGPSFQVNNYILFDQQHPDVAMKSDGSFIVTWQSLLQDGSIDGIYARRFDASGTFLGAETQVHTETAGSQSLPAIAVAHNGRYMIVWQTETDQNHLEVRGRLYSNAGQALGGEIALNTLTAGYQEVPSVSAMQEGFLVAWQSTVSAGSDQEGMSIQVRVFDLGGSPSGSEMQVNTVGAGNQQNPSVSSSDFNLAVVWDSDHDMDTQEDIYVLEEQMARSKNR